MNRLSTVIDKSSVYLCRDDGLAAINNADGPKLDRIRKDIISERDFFDVNFNLATKKYFLF